MWVGYGTIIKPVCGLQKELFSRTGCGNNQSQRRITQMFLAANFVAAQVNIWLGLNVKLLQQGIIIKHQNLSSLFTLSLIKLADFIVATARRLCEEILL